MADVREATPVDLPAIEVMDGLACAGSPRHARVRHAIDSAECVVACESGVVVGYALTNRNFFDQPFIELVLVHEAARRRGIATTLVRSIINRCEGPKLFTSTNRSNRSAQGLFEGLGFVRSGVIENLDDDDPELVYMLRVAT